MPQQTQVDGVYRSQRARLSSVVTAITAGMWATGVRAEPQTIRDVLRVVYAGQAQTVALVDAFMAIKADTQPQGLDPSRYTVDAIRGVSAEELYRRPWGALGGQIAEGAKLVDAMGSARASLARLVRTDLQLAQTHSARDWMTSDSSVTGYEREPGPNPCDLCELAAMNVYRSEDLAPIHEHCNCSVIPVTGGDRSPVAVDASVRVGDDPEIGPRLLAADWAE